MFYINYLLIALVISPDSFSRSSKLSSDVIKAAITVHKEIGPGLLETVYQSCMMMVLDEMGLKTESEVPVAVSFRGKSITDQGYRIDMLVENTIIVELKSVEHIKNVHKKQLLTYLKLANKPLGLLINFNEVLLKNGITRIVN